MNNSINFGHSVVIILLWGREGKNKDSKQATGIQFLNRDESFISCICQYKIGAVYVSLYQREVGFLKDIHSSNSHELHDTDDTKHLRISNHVTYNHL